MNYRPLGRTGVKVSELCLGCMMFGQRTEPKDGYAIIDRAIDAGINFLDTANVYARGKSEEITGEALKRNGKRGQIVLATKVHGTMDENDPNGAGNSRRHIMEQCEASLKRLQTDYIDLYQIHRPQSDVPIDETLRALDDLIRAGKVRYIGTSTFGAWQMVESLWTAERLGTNRFICEQPPYNILDRRIEREMIPVARTYGYAVIPWSPLAGGLLTGKYSRNSPPPADTRFGRMSDNPNLAKRYLTTVFDVTEGLEPIAKSKGCTMAQLSLAWVLGRPGVTSPIIGPRTMEQLEDNLVSATVSLSDEELKRIDTLVPPGHSVSPFYEADFGPSQYR
ncbi:MAG TPA: aldo/keto reductase [Spirochaetia bacterium]|nr:aldo/keto reductase [Spirochaetia bacterium]